MRRKIRSFEVTDNGGKRHTVDEFAVPAPGPGLIGGGSPPDVSEFLLRDGTQLEPLIGNNQFIDRRSGASYKRA